MTKEEHEAAVKAAEEKRDAEWTAAVKVLKAQNKELEAQLHAKTKELVETIDELQDDKRFLRQEIITIDKHIQSTLESAFYRYK
jgi:hypothetical protein